MTLILAVAVAGFIVARLHAEANVQDEADRSAEIAAAQIHVRIAQAASLTESLRRFMVDSSDTGVTSDQFTRNAYSWLGPADFPAAAWVEQVPDPQRAEYEQRTGQPIVTFDEQHRVVPAGSRSSYLPATLVSGFPPLTLPGIDLSGYPDMAGMATTLDRATRLDRASAVPVAGPDTWPNGILLVAPAPNLVGESLRPGYVMVFMPDVTLSAGANTSGLRLAVGGRLLTGGGPVGEQTVRTSFIEAGQRFDVILPRGSVDGAAATLPWIILACGLVLAGLAAALGINAARRAKAQDELDRVFNLSPDLIVVANFESHFTRVNPAAEQVLGYTRDELLERPYLDFVHPDDRERTTAESTAIGQGKPTLSFENRYVRKDGSYRVLEWTATPVVEEGLMYGVGRDVTERREAEIELERLAGEQAALRRVATLVADGVGPEEVFAAVATEVGRLLEVDLAVLNRYDPQDMITVVGIWTNGGATKPRPVGSRLPLGGRNVTTLVRETGRSARIDYADFRGAIGEVATRTWGLRSSAGVPVSVEGRLWGVMVVAFTRDETLPADAEARLAGFTELIATAVANAQARAELRSFADEQAALRRVATLVAHEAPPEEVFAAVTAEAGRVLDTNCTIMGRYDPDGLVTVIGHWVSMGTEHPLAIGSRVTLQGQNIHTRVFETGRSARIDDYNAASDAFVDAGRDWQHQASVGAPIWVEGRLWGVITAGFHSGPLPAGTEARLAGFTELVAAAIANADSQAALAASRARIVAAGDAARRRMGRDLHDGAQQRLVSLAVRVRAIQAAYPQAGEVSGQLDEVVAGLTDALEELREVSSGLHPAVLARGGLRPALKTLARRSAAPVTLDVGVDGRLPEPVELAAYFVVAEALTNAAKHADASDVGVTVTAGEGLLRVTVRDDGRGGADLTAGSGLVGLTDRVEALGGRLWVNSPPGVGTTIQVTLPLTESDNPGPRAADTR